MNRNLWLSKCHRLYITSFGIHVFFIDDCKMVNKLGCLDISLGYAYMLNLLKQTEIGTLRQSKSKIKFALKIAYLIKYWWFWRGSSWWRMQFWNVYCSGHTFFNWCDGAFCLVIGGTLKWLLSYSQINFKLRFGDHGRRNHFGLHCSMRVRILWRYCVRSLWAVLNRRWIIGGKRFFQWNFRGAGWRRLYTRNFKMGEWLNRRQFFAFFFHRSNLKQKSYVSACPVDALQFMFTSAML